MSKKNKKYQSSKPASNHSKNTENVSMTANLASTSINAMSAAAGKANYSQAFNPDYSSVIKDLKRIGILASMFFVVLIVLSFIL